MKDTVKYHLRVIVVGAIIFGGFTVGSSLTRRFIANNPTLANNIALGLLTILAAFVFGHMYYLWREPDWYVEWWL